MLLMSLSCLALGAGCGAAPFLPWPGTLVSIVLISLGIVLLIPIASTVVSRLAPVELRGRYMGVWTLVYMAGYAIGPLLGGWALDALGGRVAFAVTAVACLRRSRPVPAAAHAACAEGSTRRRRWRRRRRAEASCAASARSRRSEGARPSGRGPGPAV